MKKLFTTFAALVAAVGMYAQTTTYSKVTSTPEDWTGTYLIVCEKQSVLFNGGADADNIDAKSGPAILQDITISGDKITGTEAINSATFSISNSGDEDWPWAIQSKSGLYIGHKDTLDNGLSAEIELKSKCKQKLSIDSEGNFISNPKHSIITKEYNLRYNKDADQMRFRYFEAGKKQAVQIYKLDAATAIRDINATDADKRIKVLEDGRIIIRRNGQRYSINGMICL